MGGVVFNCILKTYPMIRTNSPDSLIAKADMAFEAACRKVIDRARQSNTETVIWRDGEILELSPGEATADLEANLAKRDAIIPS